MIMLHSHAIPLHTTLHRQPCAVAARHFRRAITDPIFGDLKTTWESGHQQLLGMTSLHHQRQRPSASAAERPITLTAALGRQTPAAERTPRVRLVLGRGGSLWY